MRAVVVLFALLTPALASAQSEPRIYVSVNGGIQRSDNTVSQSFSVQKNFEAAPIASNVDEKHGVLFDAGVVYRLARHFGVGFAASVVNDDSDAIVQASIPHPFFFDRATDPGTVPGVRAINGATGAKRRETAAHIEAVYLLPGRRVDLMFFGGPTLFRAEQTLVTDVTYAETYPFDTATYTGATTVDSTSDWAAGFHVGADLGWKLSRSFGVGAVVRYSRAQAEFNVANNSAIKADVGGIAVGGGVRFAF